MCRRLKSGVFLIYLLLNFESITPYKGINLNINEI